MLEGFKRKDAFEYTKLTEEECKSRHILGRLKGIIADSKAATRNGRLYSRELWEKVFENPIMKEKIANRVCYGELGHPADRTETDIEKIAVCLSEQPKISDDGKIYGVFDILDTPNGRLLKTLCDYGTTVGISSRGTGDLYTDDDGNEAVDPDTYDCECWDIVLVPAVETARLDYVTESINSKTFKQALCESLEKESDVDRKIMEESLNTLNIDYKQEIVDNKVQEKSEVATLNEAVDNGTSEIIASLQEALKSKSELEAKVLSLQESLAVSDTKVNNLKEEVARYKSSTIRLSTLANESKTLKTQVSTLQEQLNVANKTVETQKSKIEKLFESKRNDITKSQSLNESISNKDSEIKKLNESLTSIKESYESEISKLNEKFEDLKVDSKIKLDESNDKLSKANKIVERYKKSMKETINRYIESKATMLGVSKNEIINRLSESYTLDEVDEVCEGLQSLSLSINKLPFNLGNKTKVRVTESKNDALNVSSNRVDDDVDDSLLSLANLK